jgi:hypothetical protein
MTWIWVSGLFLAMAAVAAAISCAYHHAREDGRALTAANWGLLLDVLQTAPILFLWFADSPAALIGDFLGGWFGVFFGVRYVTRKAGSATRTRIKNKSPRSRGKCSKKRPRKPRRR